ncbi:hypothetical protein PG999_013206 [Apiospora kogelbergensis]|uniref:Zn(2)-C6 fungal-type domain-containing protein n=1 Tax=Apiospora kogelbergensis TaxID=1337665 RepID=A0AAW0QB52_9PEZI
MPHPVSPNQQPPCHAAQRVRESPDGLHHMQVRRSSNACLVDRILVERANHVVLCCRARKVKCDEAIPHCARCRNNGRACAGYAAAPPGSYSWLRLLRVRPSTIPGGGDGRHYGLEMRSLDYFRCVVAPALSGPMHTYFWTNPVQQLSVQDLSIRQAVLAISLLYEKFDDQAHDHDNTSCHDAVRRREWAALAYYNSALKQIATSDDLDINLVLFLVILFTCIECLRDNYVAAIAHCRHGVRLLRSCRNAPPEISPIVHHLSIFPFCFGATLLDFPLLPSRQISSDEPFRDVYEAGQYMDSLMARTVRLVRVTNPYQYVVPGVSDAPAVHCMPSLHELNRDLDVWFAALLELQSRDRVVARRGSPHSAIHRTVEMRWLVCKIWVETGLCQEENPDAHLAHFGRIVQLGREELADREFAGTTGRKSIFTFDMGASPLLHFAALKCRALPLRLQALVLMEKLMCPRETVWNADVLRATSRRAVELEHDIQLPPVLPGPSVQHGKGPKGVDCHGCSSSVCKNRWSLDNQATPTSASQEIVGAEQCDMG